MCFGILSEIIADPILISAKENTRDEKRKKYRFRRVVFTSEKIQK